MLLPKLIAFNLGKIGEDDLVRVDRLQLRADRNELSSKEESEKAVEELRALGIPQVRYSLRKLIREGKLVEFLTEIVLDIKRKGALIAELESRRENDRPPFDIDKIKRRIVEIIKPAIDQGLPLIAQGSPIFAVGAKVLDLYRVCASPDELARFGGEEGIKREVGRQEREAYGMAMIANSASIPIKRYLEMNQALQTGQRRLAAAEKSDPEYLLSLFRLDLPNWRKYEILQAIALMEKPEDRAKAIPQVKRLAESADLEIAIPAAEALGRMGETARAIALLRKIYLEESKKESTNYFNDILFALSAIGDPAILDDLDIINGERMGVQNILIILRGVAQKCGISKMPLPNMGLSADDPFTTLFMTGEEQRIRQAPVKAKMVNLLFSSLPIFSQERPGINLFRRITDNAKFPQEIEAGFLEIIMQIAEPEQIALMGGREVVERRVKVLYKEVEEWARLVRVDTKIAYRRMQEKDDAIKEYGIRELTLAEKTNPDFLASQATSYGIPRWRMQEMLQAMVQNDSPAMRAKVIPVLQVLAALVDPNIAIPAAEALGRLGKVKKALETLRQIFLNPTDDQTLKKINVALALGGIGEPEILDLDILKSSEMTVDLLFYIISGIAVRQGIIPGTQGTSALFYDE